MVTSVGAVTPSPNPKVPVARRASAAPTDLSKWVQPARWLKSGATMRVPSRRSNREWLAARRVYVPATLLSWQWPGWGVLAPVNWVAELIEEQLWQVLHVRSSVYDENWRSVQIEFDAGLDIAVKCFIDPAQTGLECLSLKFQGGGEGRRVHGLIAVVEEVLVSLPEAMLLPRAVSQLRARARVVVDLPSDGAVARLIEREVPNYESQPIGVQFEQFV